MTRYMLDTNIISDLIRNPHGKAAKQIAKRGERNICTSIIVAAELRFPLPPVPTVRTSWKRAGRMTRSSCPN